MDRVKIWSAIALCAALALFTDVLIYPGESAQITETRIQFQKIGLSRHVFVDDNIGFTSPLVLIRPYVAYLEPGVYYWRSSGISRVGNFTIASEVAINAKTRNGTTSVENAGNVGVDIEIRRGSLITGSAVLDVGRRIDLKIKEGIVLAREKNEE